MTKDSFVSKLPDINLHLPPVPIETLNITYHETEQVEHVSGIPESFVLPFAASKIFHLPLKEARMLSHGEDVKTVIEISLDNKESLLEFKSGDSIGILSQNCNEEVDYIIEHLNLTEKANKMYELSLNKLDGKKKAIIPPHIPIKGTIKNSFQNILDIRSVVKKVFICALSKYTEDSKEQRCLEELSSKEGSNLYETFILQKNISILDIFRIYTSCKPPVTLLFQHLPKLFPRPYSICNSSLNSETVKICFSVLEINNKLKGVATGWLEKIATKYLVSQKYINKTCEINSNVFKSTEMDLIENGISNVKMEDIRIEDGNFKDANSYTIPVYLRKSNLFHLPIEQEKPIIMVAIGTGIAPFVGFLQERRQLKNQNTDIKFGCTHLYFGCRYSDKDFIYKDEVSNFMKDGILTELKVSHSREENCPTKYVQDNIMSHAKDLVGLILDEQAVVYVCGDVNKISKHITQAFTQSFSNVRGISISESEEIMKNLKVNEQYIQDIWL